MIIYLLFYQIVIVYIYYLLIYLLLDNKIKEYSLLKSFIQTVKVVTEGKVQCFKPNALLSSFVKLNTYFDGAGQQDASECLQAILNNMNDGTTIDKRYIIYVI